MLPRKAMQRQRLKNPRSQQPLERKVQRLITTFSRRIIREAKPSLLAEARKNRQMARKPTQRVKIKSPTIAQKIKKEPVQSKPRHTPAPAKQLGLREITNAERIHPATVNNLKLAKQYLAQVQERFMQLSPLVNAMRRSGGKLDQKLFKAHNRAVLAVHAWTARVEYLERFG